jgi:uncharacterized protein YbcI
MSEISNAMVALHREHFGRGPGAARTLVADGLIVCVLTDVYTTVERTLLKAGQVDHVREARLLHQRALEDEYKATVEKIAGQRVEAFLGVTHVDPDVAVATFLLGDAEQD